MGNRHNVSSFRKVIRWSNIGALAVTFTLIGIIIASNLHLSTSTVAQVNPEISATEASTETGAWPVIERNGRYESPFVRVVELVQAAVVNISSRTRGEDIPWFAHPGVTGTSSGSGFFFRKDGYILTNSHVVKDAVTITVRTATGYEYEAELIGIDPQTDLAVIKVEPEDEVTIIPFGDSDDLRVGDWAVAIGNPFPQQGLDRTVTVGVISAKMRSNLRFGPETPRYQNYIQTDAAINPGNSGGPLLNLRGECIGVNAAISSPTGSSVGIGFAIPINIARAIVPDLIATGRVSRGWLGVWLSNVTEKNAKQLGLHAVQGVRIDSVFQGSPADGAGIRSGDVVTSFNNKEVLNSSQFMVLVSTVKGGDSVPIEVIRRRKNLKLSVTVADQETYFAASQGSPTGQKRKNDSKPIHRWLGMELLTFTAEMADDISIDFVEGVYVTRVRPGSAADRASITEGTIIRQVNKRPVGTVADVLKVAKDVAGSSRKIPFIVIEPDGAVARKVVRL